MKVVDELTGLLCDFDDFPTQWIVTEIVGGGSVGMSIHKTYEAACVESKKQNRWFGKETFVAEF